MVAVDLNPLSATSQAATVTVVDEVTRAIPGIRLAAAGLKRAGRKALREKARAFDNRKTLSRALKRIGARMRELSGGLGRG